MKERVRKPRVHARKTFVGSLGFDELMPDRAKLTVKRGCYRRATDKEGNIIADTFESGAVLWANLGDRVLLSGPTLAEIALAEVVTVYPDGALRVVMRTGAIERSTTTVHVMPCRVGGRS